MKIFYGYKNHITDDIRDITQNNKLEPDWRVIFDEYLPFQVFIEGRTIFKDLTVHTNAYYEPSEQNKFKMPFPDFLEEHTSRYFKRNNFDVDNAVAAVSGGIDSSLVTLYAKPRAVYSGYYDDKKCNELEYSTLIAKVLSAQHIKVELGEMDFLKHLNETVDTIGVPIGGFGSVMEFAALKAVKESTGADTVLFGNGGDELFLSYFFCQFVKDVIEQKCNPSIKEYMINFIELEKTIRSNLVDSIIVLCLNKGNQNTINSNYLYNSLFTSFPNNYIDKLLHITLNYTLPSLLHLNQQMCHTCEVKGLNPLANSDLMQFARQFNTPMDEIPKYPLRFAHPKMPIQISERTDKQGFPIPLHKWNTVKLLLNDYGSFLSRKEVKQRFPDGILKSVSDRYKWGMLQVEMFLRKYGL